MLTAIDMGSMHVTSLEGHQASRFLTSAVCIHLAVYVLTALQSSIKRQCALHALHPTTLSLITSNA